MTKRITLELDVWLDDRDLDREIGAIWSLLEGESEVSPCADAVLTALVEALTVSSATAQAA